MNTDTGFLKLVALIAMTIDHAGKVLFPQMPWMRIVGRLAFPIFAWCLAVGSVYTRHPRRYLARILMMAVLSQPLYSLGLNHMTGAMGQIDFAANPLRGCLLWYLESLKTLNILFALAIGLAMILCIRERKYVLLAAVTLIMVLCERNLTSSYGWRGIALMLLFYAFCDRRAASLVWVFGFMAWWGINGGSTYHLGPITFSSQMFAVMALPLIYVPTNTGIKVNKWVFYLYYPAHIAALYFLSR
ncbi:MAG: hypothetical protein IKE30_00980 [Clostridia bacterium]|nr:hypothetical protein [Clostridia bacterium]